MRCHGVRHETDEGPGLRRGGQLRARQTRSVALNPCRQLARPRVEETTASAARLTYDPTAGRLDEGWNAWRTGTMTNDAALEVQRVADAGEETEPCDGQKCLRAVRLRRRLCVESIEELEYDPPARLLRLAHGEQVPCPAKRRPACVHRVEASNERRADGDDPRFLQGHEVAAAIVERNLERVERLDSARCTPP